MKITIDTSDSLEDLRLAKELLEKIIAQHAGSTPSSPDPMPGAFSMFDERPKEDPQAQPDPQPQVQLY